MAKEVELIQKTKQFFKQYWHPDNGKQPSWSIHWNFNNSIPNHDKRGCYALFNGSEIIYIGVGIGSGLGFRLQEYWKLNKERNHETKYTYTSDWENLTSIKTIGFEEDHFHLAAALEIFLINALSPERNSQHKNKNGG